MSYLAYVLSDPPTWPIERKETLVIAIVQPKRMPTRLERIALCGALLISIISASAIGYMASVRPDPRAPRTTYVKHPCSYFHAGQTVPPPFHCQTQPRGVQP